jgi:hypothetical protein
MSSVFDGLRVEEAQARIKQLEEALLRIDCVAVVATELPKLSLDRYILTIQNISRVARGVDPDTGE